MMAATRPIRILLVDEHDLVRASLTLMIDNMPDMQVIGQAVNGNMAVEMVAELQPDVVLMDLNMPEMDGFTATRIIYGKYLHTKVIVLSASMLEADRNQAMEAGAIAFLSKEASIAEIEATIRSVVQ